MTCLVDVQVPEFGGIGVIVDGAGAMPSPYPIAYLGSHAHTKPQEVDVTAVVVRSVSGMMRAPRRGPPSA